MFPGSSISSDSDGLKPRSDRIYFSGGGSDLISHVLISDINSLQRMSLFFFFSFFIALLTALIDVLKYVKMDHFCTVISLLPFNRPKISAWFARHCAKQMSFLSTVLRLDNF